MSLDPYKLNLAGKVKFVKKRIIKARIVVVLEGTIENREIQLIHPASRCVRKGEIFELLTTPEKVKPGDIINTVTYLGFAEVEIGGVLRVGDIVFSGKKKVGSVVGFDETHFPNHQNIVLKSLDESSISHVFKLEEEIIFKQD